MGVRYFIVFLTCYRVCKRCHFCQGTLYINLSKCCRASNTKATVTIALFKKSIV